LYVARAKRADVALLRGKVEEIQYNVGKMRKENDSGMPRIFPNLVL